MYDYAVYIGRFQPFHKGHAEVLEHALTLSKTVILVVGSSNQPRNIKNPLTFAERRDIINLALSEKDRERIRIVSANDYKYNDAKWISQIQTIVTATIDGDGWRPDAIKIAIIGHSKDDSSFYLKLFPQWEPIEHNPTYKINATDIRKSIYEGVGVKPEWFSNLPQAREVLTAFHPLELIRKEYEFIKKYRIDNFVDETPKGKYPPTFVTTDAVLVQSGHILLIRRKAAPGENQWALPGGHLMQHERIEDGMLRELVEETKIGVRLPKLKGSIVKSHVFDAPDRSLRGRTITHAYFMVLPEELELPKVKGSDDAAEAKWYPISEVKNMRNKLFEDHWDIIDYFIGL